MEELFDLDSLGERLNGMLTGAGFSLKELVFALFRGDLSGAFCLIRDGIVDGMTSDFGLWKDLILIILILGILSAVFLRLQDLFTGGIPSTIGYYMVYLSTAIILLRIVGYSMDIAVEVVSNVVDFIRLLVPTYLFTVGIASGELTAVGFYKLILCVIFLAQSVILAVLLPGVQIYVTMTVMNGVMEHDRLIHLMELVRRAIRGMLRIMLGLVTGYGAIQAMITPGVDNMKRGVVERLLAAIPGIGDMTDSTVRTLYGSAQVLKNSVGVACIVILFIMAVIPMLKLLILCIVIRTAGAFASVVADKRITRCTMQIGEGIRMLLQIVATSVGLFVITLAIAAIGCGRGGI